MDPQVLSYFEDALADFSLSQSAPGIAPGPNQIAYGAFALVDTPELAMRICDQVANTTNAFWTFTRFTRWQNNNPEKPIEPIADDPSWWPAMGDPLPPNLVARHGEPKTRKLIAAYNLSQARNAYETALKEYQKLQLQIRALRQTADFGPRGYVGYVVSALQADFPSFAQDFFFTPKTLWLTEKARQRRTFICAGTGAGKSESIKHIARHYITRRPKTALVVLDPHDDLAQDIARFQENEAGERVVYISPTRFPGHRIAFNPFDFTNNENDEKQLNKAQRQFLQALEIIAEEKFSKAQRSLMTACLGVLLHRPGSSFADLVTFMDDEKNEELVEYGKAYLPNETDRDFFKDQFYVKNFETTKPALRYRFYDLFRDPVIRDFLCTPSTFDLNQALDNRGIICFGFDQDVVSEDAVMTIGQLIMAYLTSFAMSRPKGNARYPIHLFADECHYFVTNSVRKMLKETRKFGLYATLATQDINDLGLDIRRAILTNVGSYLIGTNKAECADILAKETPDLTTEDIRRLPALNFYQVDLSRAPVRTKISVIGDRFALDDAAWRKFLEDQKQQYYRPVMKADVPRSGQSSPPSQGPRPARPIPNVAANPKKDR